MKRNYHISAAILLLIMTVTFINPHLSASAADDAPGTGIIEIPEEGIRLEYTVLGGNITEATNDGWKSKYYIKGTVGPGETLSIAVSGNGTTLSQFNPVNQDLDATMSVWFDAGNGEENREIVTLAPGESGSVSSSFIVPEDARIVKILGYIGNAWINPNGGGSRDLILNVEFEVVTEEMPLIVQGQEQVPESESSEPAPNPASEGSLGRIIVIVGIAIAGTLGALAGELASKAAQAAASENEEQATEEPVYVLNPSHNLFNLEVNQPVTLNVNGYRVTQAGYQIENNALISISLPPDLAEYFSLQTTGSNGQISCIITLLKIPSASNATLEVNGVFPQGKANAQVQLAFKMEFAISPVNSPNITYYEKEKRWQAPELVASFRDPGKDIPIKVGFYYGFTDPPLTFKPDILEVKEGYTSDGGLTYNFRLKVRDGIDLETYFGKDLTADNGRVMVNVVAKDEQGKEYEAKTALEVHPQLKMMAYAYDPDKGKGKNNRPKTPYQGLELKDTQFIADGIDVLPVLFFFVRTDKEVKKGEEYLSAVDLVDILSVEFTAGKFPNPEVNEADSGHGLFAYSVRSSGFIPYTKEEEKNYALEVDPVMRAGVPKNISLSGMTHLIFVSPQFMKFHFWVVSGQHRGTSDAFAYVQLCPSKTGFPNMPLTLEIENPPNSDGGILELKSGDREQTTRDAPDYISDVPLPTGAAFWTLEYSGMSWKNLSACVFKVNCYGPESDTGPIWQASQVINVGDNISKLLNDLVDQSSQLDLINPYWKDSIVPYHLRGPIWNALMLCDSSQPYVCHWLRHKIMEWLIARSLYGESKNPKQIESMMNMNGIEFQYCCFALYHYWANLFLAGTHQINDAKALDPWWEQRWTDPALKNHENLVTVYSELNWKLGERGLALRAIAEVSASVLAIAGIIVALSIVVPFVAPMTIPSATAAIVKAFITSGPFDAIALYGGIVDQDYYVTKGKKQRFLPNWFLEFIQNLSDSSD